MYISSYVIGGIEENDILNNLTNLHKLVSRIIWIDWYAYGFYQILYALELNLPTIWLPGRGSLDNSKTSYP